MDPWVPDDLDTPLDDYWTSPWFELNHEIGKDC